MIEESLIPFPLEDPMKTYLITLTLIITLAAVSYALDENPDVPHGAVAIDVMWDTNADTYGLQLDLDGDPDSRTNVSVSHETLGVAGMFAISNRITARAELSKTSYDVTGMAHDASEIRFGVRLRVYFGGNN